MSDIFVYSNGIPANLRFIEVKGEDGTFYDLVRKGDAQAHISEMTAGGYEARAVRRGEVPACRFRDFSEGLASYRDAALPGGEQFYF